MGVSRRGVQWFLVAVACLLSLVLYVGYSVTVLIGAVFSKMFAGLGVAIGTFAIMAIADLAACLLLAMAFLNSPIEFLSLLLQFLLHIILN